MNHASGANRAGSAVRFRTMCAAERARAGNCASSVQPHPPCSIHVVTAENRRLYERQLEASFQLRHQVYVTERNWKGFHSVDGRELDQYDNAHAIYLLAIEDASRRLVGGARLVPTVRAPVLGEFGLAGRYPLPRSPYIFHVSRIIASPDRRENSSLNMVIARTLCGIQEYCLEEDIEQLTLLVRMSLLPIFIELGWNPQPLALPHRLWGDVTCVPATVDVSDFALKSTREARGVTGSVLVRCGITLPAISARPVPDRLC